ncbi:hypothetical protein V9T40_007405 [Parthenolecanium corni]|uniref:Uncharacterized protein n=1 Tax=Parthenolecanium corni TaxID=536013 RepID=A0AAN9TXC7_9HEMI
MNRKFDDCEAIGVGDGYCLISGPGRLRNEAEEADGPNYVVFRECTARRPIGWLSRDRQAFQLSPQQQQSPVVTPPPHPTPPHRYTTPCDYDATTRRSYLRRIGYAIIVSPHSFSRLQLLQGCLAFSLYMAASLEKDHFDLCILGSRRSARVERLVAKAKIPKSLQLRCDPRRLPIFAQLLPQEFRPNQRSIWLLYSTRLDSTRLDSTRIFYHSSSSNRFAGRCPVDILDTITTTSAINDETTISIIDNCADKSL